MGHAVGGAEQHGNLSEARAPGRAIRGHEGGVLGRAPVELGERGAAELRDGGVDGRLELWELGAVRVVGVGVVDVLGAGAEEEVRAEEGVRVRVVGVGGREGLAAGGHRGEEERERLLVGAGPGVRVGVGRSAGEVAEEGGGERDDGGGDGVAAEGRVPLVDLAAEQLLEKHLLRRRRFSWRDSRGFSGAAGVRAFQVSALVGGGGFDLG